MLASDVASVSSKKEATPVLGELSKSNKFSIASLLTERCVIYNEILYK